MPIDVSRIRALCFDIDGTLSDTDDLWVQRAEGFLRPVRWLFNGRNTRLLSRRFIMSLESPGNFIYHQLDHLGLDDEIALVFNKMERLRTRRSKAAFWLIPGAAEALRELQIHFPMAVVSARDEESTMAFLDQFSLRPLFQAVATAQTCRHTKPFPDPIYWAAEKMGIRPEECLMVGDTGVDIHAGKAAGAQTAGLLCGFSYENELSLSGADIILPGPYELIRVLLGKQPDISDEG